MTYNLCEKLIESKKKTLFEEDWKIFTEEIKNKLDVFLLAGRITSVQYEELNTLLSSTSPLSDWK